MSEHRTDEEIEAETAPVTNTKQPTGQERMLRRAPPTRMGLAITAATPAKALNVSPSHSMEPPHRLHGFKMA